MRTYILKKESIVKAPLAAVWKFFSDPHNLVKITPDYMKFRVLKCPDVEEVYDGMLIEYRVRPILNYPMKWITLIKKVAPLQYFTDTQISGPYALWEHTHFFEETAEGTKMIDEVKYALPLGVLGTIAHTLFVKKQLEGIFNYREKVIDAIFKN